VTDIIILTYGQPEVTIKCFESILKHTDNYRLVWVDNGSSTEARQKIMPYFLKHKVRIPLWSQINLGFVKGINFGLKSLLDEINTKSEHIVIQNNDTVVSPNWLREMVAVLEENDNTMAVGPVSSVEDSVHDWNRIFKETGMLESIYEDVNFGNLNADERGSYLSKKFSNKKCEALINNLEPKVKMLAFFCTIFKKEIFKKIGLLDDIYEFGLCDDRDYCTSIYRKGYNCAIALGSYVQHDHQTTFKSTFKNFQIQEMHQKNIERFKEKFNLK